MNEQHVREVKLRRERVSSFDPYPFSLPAVRNLHTLALHPAVTFIVGENGSGKSALPAPAPPIINSYGRRSLHEQSHGESFFALMMHRFGGQGFYVLDEPEAALSPSRQLAMIARTHQLVQARSQFIIATHSPILMAYPGAWLYQVTSESLARIEYQQTEHFIVAKRFLNDPDSQLSTLLE